QHGFLRNNGVYPMVIFLDFMSGSMMWKDRGMGEQLGKIGLSLFDKTIAGMWGTLRPEVRIGPAFGVDVALVDLPHGMTLAMSSDPLSLIPSLGLEASAWLSVHLMANDIATTGHAPMYGQFVLNLPDSMRAKEF